MSQLDDPKCAPTHSVSHLCFSRLTQTEGSVLAGMSQQDQDFFLLTFK